METLADDARVDLLQAGGYPFTLIGRTENTDGISFVDLDFGDAIRVALGHLGELGHRCVALLNFPPELLEAGLHLGADCARRVRRRDG